MAIKSEKHKGFVGLPELERAMRSLDDDIKLRLMGDALEAAASPILRTMQTLVPVRTGDTRSDGEDRRSPGSLRRSLGVQRLKRSVKVGPERDQQHIALFVEFGTAFAGRGVRAESGQRSQRRRRTQSNPSGLRTQPQPFMRPALIMNKAKSIRIAGVSLWRGISRYTDKLTTKLPPGARL